MDCPEKPAFLGCGLIYEQVLQLSDPVPQRPIVPRSPDWAEWVPHWLGNKTCAICGGKYRLVAHHIVPVYKNSELEFEPSNLIPLCEGRFSCNCHLTFGHLGNWNFMNSKVKDMCASYGLQFQLVRAT